MPTLSQALKEDNLYAGWLKVKANRGCAGYGGEDIDEFGANLWANLNTLQHEVEGGRYQPQPLIRIYISKPNGQGRRPLSIPAVRDRVLQSAVVKIITPVFEPLFQDSSFAYRRGRSVDDALQAVNRLRKLGFEFVVDADIKSYFDEVNHDLMLKVVAQHIQDQSLVCLIEQWLKISIIDGKKRFKLEKGLPQGSPISPLLANLFLDQMDDRLLAKNYRMVRYADDFLVLCRSEKCAQKALKLTQSVLAELKLYFNEDKTQLTTFNRGFRFLGAEFIRSFIIKKKPGRKARQKSSARPSITEANRPKVLKTETPQPTTLANAFQEAGIDAEQFIVAQDSNPTQLTLPQESLDQDYPSLETPEPPSYSEHDPYLHTLYITQHGAQIGKTAERIRVEFNGHELSYPAIHIDQIMIFGNAQISTQAMHFCLDQNITIYFLSAVGRFYGVLDRYDTGSVNLQKKQFLLSDAMAFRLPLANEIVRAKINNQAIVLKRYARHHALPSAHACCAQMLRTSKMFKPINEPTQLEALLGHEGNAAKRYFQALVSDLDPKWQFFGRNRQPPKDPINALLSYGYSILFYNTLSLIKAVGLNPHVGFLHPVRRGHPALASDLMEEFRAPIVDATVLNCILNNTLSPEDFRWLDAQQAGCWIHPDAKKTFIVSLEKKFNAAIRHPVKGYKIDYRRAIAHQARALALTIRDEAQPYRAFVIR